MALFLGIKHLTELSEATVAGVSAKANSSFHKDSVSGEILKVDNQRQHTISTAEQQLIAAYLSTQARQLGYILPGVSIFKGAWLRLKNRLLI
jgi:hypothetical protein